MLAYINGCVLLLPDQLLQSLYFFLSYLALVHFFPNELHDPLQALLLQVTHSHIHVQLEHGEDPRCLFAVCRIALNQLTDLQSTIQSRNLPICSMHSTHLPTLPARIPMTDCAYCETYHSHKLST